MPEVALPIDAVTPCRTYRDIWYEERNEVGYVNFRFYNGAMGTDHCERLAAAVRHARGRPTKVHRAARAGATSSRTASIST